MQLPGVALWVEWDQRVPCPSSPVPDQDILAPHGPSITSLRWFCRTGPREGPGQARAALLLLCGVDYTVPFLFSTLSHSCCAPAFGSQGLCPSSSC